MMRVITTLTMAILVALGCGKDASKGDDTTTGAETSAPSKATGLAAGKPQIGKTSMDELAKEFVQALSDKDEDKLLGLWVPEDLWRSGWQCADDARDPFSPGIARARELVAQGRLLPEAKKYDRYELTAIVHHGDEGDQNVPDLQPIDKGELAGKCTSGHAMVKGWVRVRYDKIPANGASESDSTRLWMIQLNGRWFQIGF